MPLINCEISRILTWSLTKFNRCWNVCALTDAKLYVPVVTLSTQDNAKLLEQLKPGFKRTVKWNKYQSKVSTVLS